MSCRKWRIQISKWHEGELNDEGEAALLGHLESCRHCRSLEAGLRAVSGLLAESRELAVPDFLAERITASVSEKMRDRSRFRITGALDFLSYRYRAAVTVSILTAGLCLGGLAGRQLSNQAMARSDAPTYDLLTLGGISEESRSTTLSLIWLDNGEGVGR